MHSLISITHPGIHLLHQLLRKSDGNHLIVRAVTNQDPPSPDLLCQLVDLLRRLAVSPSRDGLENEALSRESPVVLALCDLLRCVPVGVGGEDALRVGRAEELGRKEAGAGADDCGVEGAGNEDFETLLEVLEEGLMGREWGVSFMEQRCVVSNVEMFKRVFTTGLLTYSCLNEPRGCG